MGNCENIIIQGGKGIKDYIGLQKIRETRGCKVAGELQSLLAPMNEEGAKGALSVP